MSMPQLFWSFLFIHFLDVFVNSAWLFCTVSLGDWICVQKSYFRAIFFFGRLRLESRPMSTGVLVYSHSAGNQNARAVYLLFRWVRTFFMVLAFSLQILRRRFYHRGHFLVSPHIIIELGGVGIRGCERGRGGRVGRVGCMKSGV